MANRLLITVFTPTYNRVDKLHRVYDSIKSQTLQKVDDKYIFEWIIVDDGSSDNTKELVEKWQDESKFEIRYFYQENQGKPAASRKGIKEAKGELFLFADSDDAFLPETFETFYNVWNSFNDEEKEKCNDINCLCLDQYGNKISNIYPIENQFIFTQEAAYKYTNKGETWAAIKTKNLQSIFLDIPREVEKLKFIPESFFWSKIINELKQYTFITNKYLRIYYKEENTISSDIRNKYPESFEFKSLYFINNYLNISLIYPKVYLLHFIKYIKYTRYNNKNIFTSFTKLNGFIQKILYIFLYIPSKFIRYKI